jgi:Na+-transporting methylmalonyl-CoA/oxaloacetate decarboxylase gamma subunit
MIGILKIHGIAFVFILLIFSLILIQPASASVQKPSMPEFTVKYVDRSYTVPANYTYETKPYTGSR